MPDLRSPLLALLLAAAPASAEEVRALMLQARALQLRGGGADPAAAAEAFAHSECDGPLASR